MSALLTLTFVSALLSLPRVDIYDLRHDFIFEMIRAILLELHFGDLLVTPGTPLVPYRPHGRLRLEVSVRELGMDIPLALSVSSGLAQGDRGVYGPSSNETCLGGELSPTPSGHCQSGSQSVAWPE